MAPRAIPSHRFRPLIIQALLLPVIAMFVFGGVLIWRATHVLTDQWWVDHTDQVIEDASELHAVHLRAESAVRAYLLTKDSIFRDTFIAERASI